MSKLIVYKNSAEHFGFTKEFAELAKSSSEALSRLTAGFTELLAPSAKFSTDLQKTMKPIGEIFNSPEVVNIGKGLAQLGPLIDKNLHISEGVRAKAELKKLVLAAPAIHIQLKRWHNYLPGLKPFELMSQEEIDKYVFPVFGVLCPSFSTRDIKQLGVRYGLTITEIGRMTIGEIVDWFDEYEDFDLHMADIDGQVIDAQALPMLTTKKGRPDKHRVSVKEGLEMLAACQADNPFHAARILVDAKGFARQLSTPNSRGMVIANSYDAAITILQKKISKAWKQMNNSQ